MKVKLPVKYLPANLKWASVVICIFTYMSFNSVFAQSSGPYVRIAKIEVDPAQLEAYKAALKLHAETAVKLEPGVISLYAVSDKEKPSNVTVFEIYANKEAYNIHIQAPHFLKFKSTTQNMVKSLQLSDVIPIALAGKKQ